MTRIANQKEGDNAVTGQELYHYGVLGMKWGVRRGRASEAFAKASKKADRLHRKAAKMQAKATRLVDKGVAKESVAESKRQIRRTEKLLMKADKVNTASAKAYRKAMIWEAKMSSTFSKVKISDISDNHLIAGQRYADMLMIDDVQ